MISLTPLMCPLHVLMWDSVIQRNPVKCCRYLWLLFCPVGERYSVMRTHKNHLPSLSPESSWFKSLSTSMNKCINVHLHMHSTLARCLSPSPTISERLCHKPVKWRVTEPTNRCREKYGRTAAVRRNRSETFLFPPPQKHHMNRGNSRNTLNYWSRADVSQSLYTQTATVSVTLRDPRDDDWFRHGFSHRKYQRNSKKKGGGCWHWSTGGLRCVKSSNTSATLQEWDY